MKDQAFKYIFGWVLIVSLTFVSCSRIQVRDVSSSKEAQGQIQLPILRLSEHSPRGAEKRKLDKSKLRVVVQIPVEGGTSPKKEGLSGSQNIQFFPSLVEIVALNQGQQTLSRGTYAIHFESKGLVARSSTEERLIAPVDLQGHLDWSQSLYECLAFRDSDGRFMLELRHLFVQFQGLKIKEYKNSILPSSWLKKVSEKKADKNYRGLVSDQGLVVKRVNNRFLLSPVEVLVKSNIFYMKSRVEPFLLKEIAVKSGSAFNIIEKVRFFRVITSNSSGTSLIF